MKQLWVTLMLMVGCSGTPGLAEIAPPDSSDGGSDASIIDSGSSDAYSSATDGSDAGF